MNRQKAKHNFPEIEELKIMQSTTTVLQLNSSLSLIITHTRERERERERGGGWGEERGERIKEGVEDKKSILTFSAILSCSSLKQLISRQLITDSRLFRWMRCMVSCWPVDEAPESSCSYSLKLTKKPFSHVFELHTATWQTSSSHITSSNMLLITLALF